MKIYERYDTILTFDDKLFYNKNLLPTCLSANKFVYLQNYSNREIDFYYEKFLPNREVKELHNIYIFIFNRGKQSGGNFFHFHFHYLQRIIGFFLLNNDNIKLGIPLNMLDFHMQIQSWITQICLPTFCTLKLLISMWQTITSFRIIHWILHR